MSNQGLPFLTHGSLSMRFCKWAMSYSAFTQRCVCGRRVVFTTLHLSVSLICCFFPCRSVHTDLLCVGAERVWRHVHDLHFSDGEWYIWHKTWQKGGGQRVNVRILLMRSKVTRGITSFFCQHLICNMVFGWCPRLVWKVSSSPDNN